MVLTAFDALRGRCLTVEGNTRADVDTRMGDTVAAKSILYDDPRIVALCRPRLT